MSETLQRLLSSGKGYRTEVFSGSGERDLEEVLHHEFFALCNNDIAVTLMERYGHRYRRPDNEKAWDTIQYYAQYNWDEEGDDPWFELKYDLLESIPKVLRDIAGRDVTHCLWVAEKDAALQHYARGRTDKVDCYDLTNHVAVLSDLGEGGCLLGFLECPNPITDRNAEHHEPFACVNMYNLGDLYHVGTMDISKKSNVSYEGNGLSVSICPDEWCKITEGHTYGDYFLLSKPDMQLLDYYGLSDEEKAMIREWAVENGYVKRGTLYHSISYDEEGHEYYSVYEDYDTALLEADYEEDRVRQVDGLLPTAKLVDQSLVKVELLDVPDIITELYAEQVLDYDGIYWDEILDVASYSAPRGVIFNSKLPTFDITNTTKELKIASTAEKKEEAPHMSDVIFRRDYTLTGLIDISPEHPMLRSEVVFEDEEFDHARFDEQLYADGLLRFAEPVIENVLRQAPRSLGIKYEKGSAQFVDQGERSVLQFQVSAYSELSDKQFFAHLQEALSDVLTDEFGPAYKVLEELRHNHLPDEFYTPDQFLSINGKQFSIEDVAKALGVEPQNDGFYDTKLCQRIDAGVLSAQLCTYDDDYPGLTMELQLPAEKCSKPIMISRTEQARPVDEDHSIRTFCYERGCDYISYFDADIRPDTEATAKKLPPSITLAGNPKNELSVFHENNFVQYKGMAPVIGPCPTPVVESLSDRIQAANAAAAAQHRASEKTASSADLAPPTR